MKAGARLDLFIRILRMDTEEWQNLTDRKQKNYGKI